MKKVFVTGGSGGIGSAIVKKFADNGYAVAFTFSQNEKEAERISKDTGAFPIKSDLSDPESAKKCVKEAIGILSGIDILVNCAGISLIKPFDEMTDSEIERIMNIDLVSAMIVSREASVPMIKHKYGKIINIGSMWGERGASCEVAYSAAKAGLRGFTKALAKELGPSGINVNCVEPGFINTKMNSKFDKETFDSIVESTPIGRAGTPEDVSECVYFLALDSSSFITGQCIGVDGGIII